jgi:hypothetical protein
MVHRDASLSSLLVQLIARLAVLVRCSSVDNQQVRL